MTFYPTRHILFAKRTAALFLFACTAGISHLAAQTTISSPPGVITFQRSYPLQPQEYLYGMTQTSDSGFAIAGQQIDFAAFTFETYVKKTDKYGNVQWAKTIGAGGGFSNIERLSRIRQTSDGGYICSGGTSLNSDMYVYKLDASGNVTWIKTFGNFFGQGSTEGEADVIETADGGYLLTGSTDSITSSYSLFSLIKVNAAGTVQWQKHYSGFGGTRNLSGGRVISTSDGNYAIVGNTSTISGDNNVLLFKIDPAGDTLWTKTYDVYIDEHSSGLEQSPDGGYIISGSILDDRVTYGYDTATFLLKVDSLGAVQWSKAYRVPGNQMSAYFLDVVSTGGYVFGGFQGVVASGLWNYFMVKTDANGDTLWTRVYNQSPNMPSVPYDGYETSDGGFILGGTGGSIGGPTNTDIVLVKTDSAGRSGCFEQTYPVITTLLTPGTGQRPYFINSTNVSGTPVFNVVSHTPSVAVACCHVPLEITGYDTVCVGDSVTLTAGGAYSYQWSTGATTPSITVLAATSTTVSVNGFSGPGVSCDILPFSIAAVTVNPAITGNTTICEGSSTTLTASGGTAYQWSTSATTAAVTVSPAVTTTYFVDVSVGSCTASDSVTVTVNPSPVASISAVDTICSGESATLIASGGGTYQWSTGATTSSVTVSPSAATTYSVVVSNGLCTDSASLTLFVNASPIASVSGVNAICAGDTTTLTASGGGTYQWSTGGTSTSVTVTPSSSTSYSVVVTSPNGCSDTATYPVTVTPVPVASISGSTDICSGASTQLTASGGAAYSWSTGATTAAITVSAAGTYSVIVSSGACADTAFISVNVLPLPVASAGTSDTIFIGNSTVLNATGGGTYTWSPPAGLSCTNCQDPVADPTQTTIYCVMVTDSNGCTDNDCITIFVDTECGELFIPNAFSPNNDNANDRLCIYGSQCIEQMTLVIYDRWGEKVFETTDPSQCWDGTYRGELMNTAVFVYYLEAVLVNGNVLEKKGNITLLR